MQAPPRLPPRPTALQRIPPAQPMMKIVKKTLEALSICTRVPLQEVQAIYELKRTLWGTKMALKQRTADGIRLYDAYAKTGVYPQVTQFSIDDDLQLEDDDYDRLVGLYQYDESLDEKLERDLAELKAAKERNDEKQAIEQRNKQQAPLALREESDDSEEEGAVGGEIPPDDLATLRAMQQHFGDWLPMKIFERTYTRNGGDIALVREALEFEYGEAAAEALKSYDRLTREALHFVPDSPTVRPATQKRKRNASAPDGPPGDGDDPSSDDEPAVQPPSQRLPAGPREDPDYFDDFAGVQLGSRAE